MRNTPDPSVHRKREELLMEHVQRLLEEKKLRLETRSGRKSISILRSEVTRDDREVDLKRLMSEMDIYDRELQNRMPVGQHLTATLWSDFLIFFKRMVGRLHVVCLSPREALLEGKTAPELGGKEVREALARTVPPGSNVADTVILLSSSGFDESARALTKGDGPQSLILVEPNEAGGWKITGPARLLDLCEQLDPEKVAEKRKRVRSEIELKTAELLMGGLPARSIAEKTQLPLQLVEDELELYGSQTPGLVARRLDGNVVLFREGAASLPGPGGADMPFIQRLKSMFGMKDDDAKKIALLSERRAAINVQKDKAIEEMQALEKRESEMKDQFKETSSAATKKRIASQMVQLRKEMEHKQQLLGIMNQQETVINAQLRNLEVLKQGQGAQLPSSEALADDAAKAEEMLADLQASAEMAGSMTATGMGLSDEEQAMLEELEAETSGKDKEPKDKSAEPAKKQKSAEEQVMDEMEAEPPAKPQRQRGQAEPG